MNIALSQLNFHVGNFELNTSKIINSIEKAKENNVDLIVFPELSICGYPPRDFLDYHHFVEECNHHVEKISKSCVGIAAIVGSITFNADEKGKDLFNSAIYMADGKIKEIVNKSLLPTYDIFDEYRYFEPAKSIRCITVNGVKIALTICEDLWNLGENPLYNVCPMDILIKDKPELIVNIAASPFSYSHNNRRIDILGKNVEKYNLPIIYVNQVGAQTELIFDGNSMVLNKKGEIYQLNEFSEDLFYFEFNTDIIFEKEKICITNKYEKITSALTIGIQDFFNKSGFKRAILGLSGGIDSALVLALTYIALGKENVFPILMPSPYSSEGSIKDSIEMCNRLDIEYEILPISNIMDSFSGTLKPVFKDLPHNIAEENIQSRTRGTLLMAISNKLGYILLNTSNKSELSVGYSTLYGDSNGALSIIGDLYKTEVYELSKHINTNYNNLIPENIITKAPSAELRPDQKDSDSLPEYSILDKILFEYIENKKGLDEILALGFDEEIVLKTIKLVNGSEFKRFQFPPILRISDKAFGSGRRMPLEAKYLL
jgi:NAD+ synthase (glutamine-hydrolysing)